MNIRPIPVIAMQPCESSNVKAHGYDASTETLAIKFRASSASYHYQNVPADVYKDLKASSSVGAFITSQVKPIYEAVLQPS
jgi:protein-disulfide isomerase